MRNSKKCLYERLLFVFSENFENVFQSVKILSKKKTSFYTRVVWVFFVAGFVPSRHFVDDSRTVEQCEQSRSPLCAL